jgi:hypothetical protein
MLEQPSQRPGEKRNSREKAQKPNLTEGHKGHEADIFPGGFDLSSAERQQGQRR